MNALQTQSPQTSSLQQLVRNSAYTKRFEEVLKDRAPQFMSSLISVGETMPDVEPKSIIACAMQAAVLSLPIEKNFGFAWIVPYRDGGKKYAQFQIGARGIIQLALRTAQYSRMNARAINREAFVGTDEVGEPIIDWNKIDETQPVWAYVFAFKMVNGFSKVCCWTKKRVEEHASRYSQSFKSGFNSPWKTHFDQMALKTVIKNELSDWGILSVELVKAFGADQAVQRTPEDEPEFLDIPAESLPQAHTAGATQSGVLPTVSAPASPAPAEKPKRGRPAKVAEQNGGGDDKPSTGTPPVTVSSLNPPPISAEEPETAGPAPTPAATEPEEAQPDEDAPEPAKAPEATPAAKLKDLVESSGFDFSLFKAWGMRTKWIKPEQVDKIQSFDDFPADKCVKLLEARDGFLNGLKKQQSYGAMA